MEVSYLLSEIEAKIIDDHRTSGEIGKSMIEIAAKTARQRAEEDAKSPKKSAEIIPFNRAIEENMSIFKACNQEYNDAQKLKKEQELVEKTTIEEKKRAIAERFAPALEVIVAFLNEEKNDIELAGFYSRLEIVDDDDRFTLARLHFKLGVEGKPMHQFKFMASVNADFSARTVGWRNTIGANYDEIFEQKIASFGEASFRTTLEESFREFVKVAFQQCEEK